MTNTAITKFSATSNRGTRTCRLCGKRTWAARVDACIDLCRACDTACSLENEHADSGHATPVAACPTCNPAAAPRPVAPAPTPAPKARAPKAAKPAPTAKLKTHTHVIIPCALTTLCGMDAATAERRKARIRFTDELTARDNVCPACAAALAARAA